MSILAIIEENLTLVKIFKKILILVKILENLDWGKKFQKITIWVNIYEMPIFFIIY